MNKVENQSFVNEFVLLDFSLYINCKFKDCTIHTDTGYFGLQGCTFDNCKLSLGKPAENIGRLIKLFFKDTPIFFEDEKT